MHKYFYFLCIILLPLIAHASSLETKLENPIEEARAQAIFKQLRCMVCAGESIHDSNADLAKDLRQLVRERIRSGESDEAVITYLTSRYGESILMEPPVNYSTYFLWFGPVVFLIVGVVVVAMGISAKEKKSP